MNRRLGPPWLIAWCCAVSLFWAATIARSGGLFAGSLSVDFRSFWAATQAFLTVGPAAAYDMPALARIVHGLAGQGGAVAGSLVAAPAPYPPPFFLILAPFALVWPPIGFLGWTLFNLVLALLAIRPALQAARAPWIVGVTAVLFFPLAFSLYAGQPSGVLLFGVAQVFRTLQAEQDFRAGLWLGLLLLKPQYALGLLLVLLLKRRRRALVGAALAGAALALASLALVGVHGLLMYRSLLDEVAGYRSAPAGIAPNIMVSWRGFLLNLLPGLSDAQGVALTLALSALTLCALPVIWRGPWRPRDAGFAPCFLITTAVTLLVAYHSHIYGAALLLVPGALVAEGSASPARMLSWLAVILPYPLLFLTESTPLVASLLTALLVLAVILGVYAALSERMRTAQRTATLVVGIAPGPSDFTRPC